MAADLERLRSEITRLVPTPPRLALLLIGGFGRGEGAVLRGRDGVLRAFNDYDLVLLVDGEVDPAPLARASVRLAAELDVDFVDLGIVRRKVLESRPLDTIYAYEMREGHRVIDGPTDALARMPAIDPAHLPLVEGSRLLANRGYGLVWARLHLEEALESPESFTPERRRFTINALEKGVLASGEAALLLAGRYHWSYRERAVRLPRVPLPFANGERSDFLAAFERATRFKLAPMIGDDSPEEILRRWEEIRAWHGVMLRHLEEQRLGRRFADWKGWEGVVARAGFLSALRRPLRFLRERAAGGSGAAPGAPLRERWFDRDHAARIRLPAILYGVEAGRPAGEAWRREAKRLVEAWHA